jgi:metallo-beta-lactamase family protein
VPTWGEGAGGAGWERGTEGVRAREGPRTTPGGMLPIPMASVTFLGACGCVTGSSTLLAWGDSRLLVDCGLYQGDDELEERNRAPFPYRPSELDGVVLTHAHLDHTGLLPRLVAEGFKRPIYCSRASRGLVSLILQDAGQIQEEEARWARRKGYSRHPVPRPLYTADDARRALRLLEPLDFDQDHQLLPGVRLRLRRAGHLLGAASLEIAAKGSDGERRSWCFSGDVGRYGVPLLKDPEPPLERPSVLILESTYGDREHAREDVEERLAAVIDETFDRGGMVVIPAFALGRTQEVLYHLAALADRGRLDPSAVFIDSPMAIDATELYQKATAEHDEDMAELVRLGESPLASDRFQRCRTVDQSKVLNGRREPAVIVAASGMANGGRVVHHLLHRLGDPDSAVVFTGYQAAGTRGRALVEGVDLVAIQGETVRVRARVHQLHGLSAHADRTELLRWCGALPGVPDRVFLNHGEDPARKALAAALAEPTSPEPAFLEPAFETAQPWPRPNLPRTGDSVPW